jgi:peptidoglycan/LPS O-acetylase OafA/YrhL
LAHQYRRDIDGLRGFSVILVIAFHAFSNLFPGGFIGVDVFFVISGYLISNIIFHETDDGVFSVKTFYARRVRRIFPALALILLSVLSAGLWFLSPADLVILGQQIAASAAFLANIYFWTQSGYFAPDAKSFALLHLWSLGVEEQFYIIWPIILVFLSRWRRWVLLTIVLFGVTSFALNFLFTNSVSANFYFPTNRAWELMLGAVLARAEHDRYPLSIFKPHIYELASALGLLMICAGALLIKEGLLYRAWYALLVPTLGAALLIWTGKFSRIGRLLLGSKIAVAVGLISYPLYLWHWPALWLVRLLYLDPSWEIILATCVVSGLLAWMTYEAVELPIRRGFNRYPPLVTASLASTLAVSFAGGMLVSRDGLPGRWDSEVAAYLRYKVDLSLYKPGTCHLIPEQGPSEFAAECFGDTKNATQRLVLWGDSAATAIYVGMHKLNNGKFDIAELTSSGCPPFIGDYKPLAERPHCSAINSFVFRYIQTNQPDIVVLTAAPSYQTDIPKRFSGTITKLKELGISKILVVGPPPYWSRSLPQIQLQNYFYGHPRVFSDKLRMPASEFEWQYKLDRNLGVSVKMASGLYVSALSAFCSDDGLCTTLIDNEPVSWDQFHFTERSSALVAERVFAALAK